jgi:hypothetical protein
MTYPANPVCDKPVPNDAARLQVTHDDLVQDFVGRSWIPTLMGVALRVRRDRF